MKDLLKIMFVPIVGCVAIGFMFLFIIWGGFWTANIENDAGKFGMATADLPQATDGYITFNGECDSATYRPVCGIDGVTYDNACYAVKASTTVAHLGMCGSRTD